MHFRRPQPRNLRERGLVPRPRPIEGDIVPHAPRRKRPANDPYPLEADLQRFSGITQTCPDCGTELYDDVEQCWNCGSAVGPGNRPRTVPPWMLLVLGAVIAGLAGVYAVI